jgi:hypothetical protein
MKKNILLTITIAALTLAACNDDASDNTAASAIPLQITAVVQNGTTTRGEIVEVSQFADNNSIGVTGGKDSNGKDRTNVKYTLSGKTWSSDNPIYYQDKENVSFKAYYPYTENATYEGVEAKDFLFAEADDDSKSNVTTNEVKFTFKHKMSKIALTFQKGTGVTDDDDISECYIGGVYTTGSFNTTNGVAEAETSGNRDFQETNFDKETLTASAILYPQTAPNTDDGIYVVVKVNNVNYKTTLITAGNSLVSGNVYSYTVTINKTGLSVEVNSGITAWDDSTTEATADVEDPTFTELSKVRLYDLAMSDGSFLHVDLTGDGIISDEELETLETRDLENVVGIVLWLGNPIDDTKTISITDADLSADNAFYVAKEIYNKKIYDPILKKDCSGCTHGLIAGIKCAQEDDSYKSNSTPAYPWQWTKKSNGNNDFTGTTENISTKFQDANKGYSSSDGYLYIDGGEESCKVPTDSGSANAGGRSDKNPAKINALNNLSRFMGYNNTKVIKAYAAYYIENNQAEDGSHVFMTSCLEYSYGKKISGDNFSEWFIPSMWELYVMLGGDETKSLGDEGVFWEKGRTTSRGTSVSLNKSGSTYYSDNLGLNAKKIGYIMSIISTLKGLEFSYTFDLDSGYGIWTSTEFYSDVTAYCYYNSKFSNATKGNMSAPKQILAVCAF